MSNSDQPQARSPSTANKTSGTEGSSGWWQHYLVRYATGTAVGAVIFYFLCSRSVLLKSLFLAPDGTTKVDAARLMVLAAYGLASGGEA